MGRGTASLRVGIVGARRCRQGIGHHLARFAAEAGAEVVGIVGTSRTTLAEAGEALEAQGMTPSRHRGVAALLAREPVDVLFVASPYPAHDEALAAALSGGVHVLCEKPLCWGKDASVRARGYVDAYGEAGLHLAVNTQWPYTLDTWRALFPGALEAAPQQFRLRLSPVSLGRAMIPDAVPHALSLLQAVAFHADARIEAPRIRVRAPDGSRIEVTFVYATPDTRIHATVDLRRSAAQPREAGYGFDGHFTARRVEMDGYRLFLETGDRRIPLPDPTPRLVRAFLDRVSSSLPPTPDPNAWPGVAHLEAIDAAWAHAEDAFAPGEAGNR